MNRSGDAQAEIGIIGGSGLYELAGMSDAREVRVETPFGEPSDAFLVGRIGDREVAFLARHGRGHDLLPGELNYRANIFALKSLGVERILSASAVGSMREEIHERDVVVIDQFIDRTRGRPSTFFGGGVVAHVSVADPICPVLRGELYAKSREQGARAHDGGCYICIEGPAFSTRAESRLYRSWGADVIGMTNLQEAKLSREAEICYATLALVCDYDCWHEHEDDVSVTSVLSNLAANSELAATVVRETIVGLPDSREGCDCASALQHAIITPKHAISAESRERLAPLIGKYLDPEPPARP